MTRKLYIPSIGDEIKLASEWQFPCFAESRNRVFIQKYQPDFSPSNWYQSDGQSLAVTFPAGTILKVARIYIRAGKSDYDSITFTIKEIPGTPESKSKGRFWAKLRDVNEIEFETVN